MQFCSPRKNVPSLALIHHRLLALLGVYSTKGKCDGFVLSDQDLKKLIEQQDCLARKKGSPGETPSPRALTRRVSFRAYDMLHHGLKIMDKLDAAEEHERVEAERKGDEGTEQTLLASLDAGIVSVDCLGFDPAFFTGDLPWAPSSSGNRTCQASQENQGFLWVPEPKCFPNVDSPTV